MDVRARQPGTHARPAAGGVSEQVRPPGERTASLTDKYGARLVARHDVLRGGAPARGAACFPRQAQRLEARDAGPGGCAGGVTAMRRRSRQLGCTPAIVAR